MLRTPVALALSTHPLPSVAVTAITLVLGIGVGLEPWRLVVLGLALLIGQASVGLSNDWLDAERDRAVGRRNKPVADGRVSIGTVRTVALVAAGLAIALTLPLGWAATLAHTTFIVAGWAYNAVLKRKALSVLPYLSFGLLPLIVTLALPNPSLAAPWAILAGALLGVAAHFANVLPDLADDRATGVRGLPHRVGRRMSGVTIAVTLAAASIAIVLGPGTAAPELVAGLVISLLLAATCTLLVMLDRAQRAVFWIIIASALIDVVLLALSGQRLLA
jgi:4-hydroxybenzoate polyprenyltransferase